MKQKLALISALMHELKLLLLTNRLSALTPKASHLLKIEMRELCRQGSATFFLTHVLEVAEKLCR